MAPGIKGPLEFLTGQSFFQSGDTGGRPLEDLDPTVGRILSNVTGQEDAVTFPGSKILEMAVSNSPLSRAATTARTLTDPRKGVGARALNTLTGFRVTDVSVPAQERALERQAASIMKGMGGRTFERPYFSEERLQRMSEPNRALAEKLLELQQAVVERRQARAQAAK
jgi:hypothetical protein